MMITINNQNIDISQLTDEQLLVTYDYLNQQARVLKNYMDLIKDEARQRVQRSKRKLLGMTPEGKFIYTEITPRVTKKVNYEKLRQLLKDKYDEVVQENAYDTFSIVVRKNKPKTLTILETKVD